MHSHTCYCELASLTDVVFIRERLLNGVLHIVDTLFSTFPPPYRCPTGSTDGKESSSGSEVDTDTDTDRQIAARDMGQSVEHPDRRAARVRERTRVAGQTEGRDDGVAGQREQPEGGDDEESEEEERTLSTNLSGTRMIQE